MTTPFRRGSTALLAAVAAWLLLQPATAQAHPQLVGRWSSTTAPNVNLAYEFAPGHYLGDGVWQGTYTVFVANTPIADGEYELRMYYGTMATLRFRDGMLYSWSAGNVDLAARVLFYHGTLYRP
jgi:hypothetical protein